MTDPLTLHRQRFPDLASRPDLAVAQDIASRYYSNKPQDEVLQKLGINQPQPTGDPETDASMALMKQIPGAEAAGEHIGAGMLGVTKSAADLGSLGLRGLTALGITDRDTLDKFNTGTQEMMAEGRKAVGYHPFDEALGNSLPYLLAPPLRVAGGLGEMTGVIGHILGGAIDAGSTGAAYGALSGAGAASTEGTSISTGAEKGGLLGAGMGTLGGATSAAVMRLGNSKLIPGFIQDIKDYSSNVTGIGNNLDNQLFKEAADRFTVHSGLMQQAAKMADKELPIVPQSALVKQLQPLVTQARSTGASGGANIIQGVIDDIGDMSMNKGVKFSDLTKIASNLSRLTSRGPGMTADKAAIVQAAQVVNQYTTALGSRTSPQVQQALQQAAQFNPSLVPASTKELMPILKGKDVAGNQAIYDAVKPTTRDSVRASIMIDALRLATRKDGNVDPLVLKQMLTQPGSVPWIASEPRAQLAVQGLQNYTQSHAVEVAKSSGSGLAGIGHWSTAWGAMEWMLGHAKATAMLPGMAMMAFQHALSSALHSQSGIDFLAANGTTQAGTPVAAQAYRALMQRFGGGFAAATDQTPTQPPVGRPGIGPQ